MARLEAEIYDLAGESFNLGSPKQIRRYSVRQDGPARRQEDRDRRLVDVGERARGSRRDRATTSAARILDWRQLSKLKSTYTDALPSFVNKATQSRPHLLCAGRDDDGAALVVRAQSAEHPGAQRSGPQDSQGLRRRARPCADLRRLFADRIAAARAYRRHTAIASGLRRGARHSRDDGVAKCSACR